MKTTLLIATLATICAGIPAQASASQSLLFTVLGGNLAYERTRAPKPLSLNRIYTEDVAAVWPKMPGAYSARKFAPHDAWCTLMGDEDADMQIWERPLARHIDAMCWRYKGAGRSMRELYISTSQTITGNNVNKNGTVKDARPGDVFRVAIDAANGDGQFYFFLREEQIRSAFQINVNETINVDAITCDWAKKLIYFSLEEDHMVTVNNAAGAIVSGDGSILALRVSSFATEPVTLAPAASLMVAHQPDVDGRSAASGIRNAAGAVVNIVGDVDGLDLGDSSATCTTMYGTWANLMVCGEGHTGGGIIYLNGTIAMVNGVPMGTAVGATQGGRVGLNPGPNVGSLNGLQLRKPHSVSAFVTETPAPVIVGPGNLRVDIEAPVGGGILVLLLQVGTMPIHPLVPATVPLSNISFPETIWPTPFFFPVPLNPQGIGAFNLGLPALNLKVISQAVVANGTDLILSTPCTHDLYPM